MDSKKPLYKSIPFWIVVLLLLYSALGFFAIPYFAKKHAKDFVINELNSTLTINQLTFNPFNFSSTATGIKLTDNDSTLWFSADKITINLNLWGSLFNNPSIDQLSVNNPFYKVITENINNEFSVKYPKLNPSDAKQTPQEEFILDVTKISVTKGAIEYNDQSGDKHFNLNLKELNFNHQLFTTKDTDSQFDLSFKTHNDDESHLSGLLNFAQLKLNANWELKNWTTATVFNFISDEDNLFYGLNNQSGLISGNGSVAYNHSDNNKQAKITIDQLNLSDFKTTHDTDQHLDINKIYLSKAVIDLTNETINLDKIETEGALVDLTFRKDNSIIWPVIQKDNKRTSSVESQSSWSFKLKQLHNTNAIIIVKKSFNETILSNTIKLLTMTVDNISSDSSQTIELQADINLDESGKIKINSTIVSEPLVINSTIKAQAIDLSKFKAWIPSDLKLEINNGFLSIQQDLIITDDISSQGSIQVEEIELFDKNKMPFLAIKKLDLEQFKLDSNNKIIKLNNIKLDQAQGMVLISADKQLNLSEIIETSTTTNKEHKEKADDWKIEIDKIELLDAKTSFIDKSIKPQYQTELSKLNGHIKGLSSANLSKAKVQLSGVIDSYGKVTIKGKINPLAEKAYTDLSIDINNLNLQNFNSYSSRYLGFPINRGQADFRLKYKLNQSILKGINNLTFKQLKFGNKTASKEAVNLPLKLAVTLLTDGKGIMKINMPVSGNIDDPDFSYGGLVFKAFFKLITGIVASPFKLLGKLIPGGADLDLSGVQFQAGSALLQTGEEQKLKAMQQILSKKPNLNLELTAITHTNNDSDALRVSKLLQLSGLDSIPNFTDKSQLSIIKKLYEKQNFTKNWQQLTDESSSEGEVKISVLLEKAWNKLLAKQDVTTELIQLARQRALLVQSQLIERYSVKQDKIFLKNSENSQELPPQVKFGVAQ
jgi:hypothetical protein